MKRILNVVLLTVLTFIVSCKKEEIDVPVQSENFEVKRLVWGFPETFESGTKTSYTAGNCSLGSGSWYFNNALIGTSSSDRKTGSKSARIQQSGSINMNFTNYFPVNFVTISHAKYGTTSNSTWQLLYSIDGGNNWVQAGGTITTSTTTLTSTTFQLNLTTPARFKIQKLSGSGILNIDNFIIDEVGEDPTRDNNMALGNPSGAITNVVNSSNYLLVKNQYTLSYNSQRGGPNWVSWHLSSAWKGPAPRCDCFNLDSQLPSSFFRASSSSYTGSGFDRGHMCPSEDRDGSTTDNSATFLMSNILPQAPNNNQITWNNFESYCRTLLSFGNELYIISGGVGSGGTGSNGGVTTTISNGQITVPQSMWKIALVIPIGSNDVTRVTNTTRVISILTPNNQTVSSQPWWIYRTSVDQIEALTGYDFLSNVPVDIQTQIESVTDNVVIQ